MSDYVLVINAFDKNDKIEDRFWDINGKALNDAADIRDDMFNIQLEDIFGVSPLITTVKDISVLLCKKLSANKSIAVACMMHATVYRECFDYNWSLCRYNIECDAKNAYIIPEREQKKYSINKFLIDNSFFTKMFLKKISVEKNCIKFDTSVLDKKATKAKTVKELWDISIEYDNAYQYDKILKLWQTEYERNRTNTDVIFQLAVSYMDCCEYEKARKLFEQVFEKKKSDQFFLSRLAVLYFILYYNEEAFNVANMIEDMSYLNDWGYTYEYITSYAPVVINVDNIMGNEIIKHKIDIGFNAMKCPKIITDNYGVQRYMDPIRKKGIPVTKEETVRQKILQYLLNICKIPENLIISEDHMTHYEKGATTRADITVRNGEKTLLIVECKEPSVIIDGEPIRQLFGYNTIMNSKYLLLSNGKDSYIFQRSSNGDYESILSLPDYKTMISEENVNAAAFEKAKLIRPGILEINSKKVIEQYRNDGMYLGVNTPDEIAPFVLNLMWSFLDTSYMLNDMSGYGVKIVKDNGIVDMTLTNVSGGKFPGCYRQFLVKDRHSTDCLVEFAVLGTYAESDTKGGYTSLVCGVDRTSHPIARLELRIDACCNINDKSTYLFHNGVRSRKRCQTTIDYVYSICKNLVKENKINLGTFQNDKLIRYNDRNVQDFILRLISYVLLRDEMSELKL